MLQVSHEAKLLLQALLEPDMSQRGSLATFERSPWPRLQLRAEGECAVPRAFSLGNMAAMVAMPQAAMPHAASMSSVISLELSAAALMAPPPPPAAAAAAASDALSDALSAHDETDETDEAGTRNHRGCDETDETLLESMRGHHLRPSEVIRADAASTSAAHTWTVHAADSISDDARMGCLGAVMGAHAADSISDDARMGGLGAVMGAFTEAAPAPPRFVRDSSEAAAASPRFVRDSSEAAAASLRFVNETPSYAEAMEMPVTTQKLPTAVKGHQWPSMAMPATMPPSSAVEGGASADLGACAASCIYSH